MKISPRPKPTVTALLALALSLWPLADAALGAWSSQGAGSAGGGAQTMPAGLAPTVPSVARSDVAVTWPAVTFASGDPVGGYVVRRFDAASGAEATVGAGCAGTVTATTCIETGVPAGTWAYTDTPVQDNWSGSQSPVSNPVRVVTVTSPSLSLPTEVSAGGRANVVTGSTPDHPSGTPQVIATDSSTSGPDSASPSLNVSGPGFGTVGSAVPARAISAALSHTSGTGSTGKIDFAILGPSTTPPSTCSGGADLGAAPVSGDGTYEATKDFSPTQSGTYWLYATYSGDKTDRPAASACPPAARIVVSAVPSGTSGSPAVTATGSGTGDSASAVTGPTLSVSGPTSATVGTAVGAGSFTATLAGSSASATGTIDFAILGPSTVSPSVCSGGADLGVVPVSGDGTYQAGKDFIPTQPGTYWLYAVFSGDLFDKSAASACPSSAAVVVSQG